MLPGGRGSKFWAMEGVLRRVVTEDSGAIAMNPFDVSLDVGARRL